MAEKLKQDILQPIPKIIGTNETASSESTARNALVANKQTAQQFGDKKLSPNSSLKTAIIFGQEYARLAALGDPNAQLNALVAAVPPVFTEDLYFKVEEYDMGEVVATYIWEAKYPFTTMPADFLDNPPDPAPPIWEQVQCAEGYYDEPFTTTNHDIYFTHYIDGDGYTYQDTGNIDLDSVTATDSTTTLNTIDVWAGRTEYKPDDYDYLYRSQGSGEYSYSKSTALKVNSITKMTIQQSNSYTETWDFIWDEFDEVVIKASVTRAGQLASGYENGYDKRGIGGGDILAAYIETTTSFGPYIYEYDCNYESTTSWSVSTSNASNKVGAGKLSLNGTVISSKSSTENAAVNGMRSNAGSACLYSHNALVASDDARQDTLVQTGPESAAVGCAFGGGSSEFYALFTLDNENASYVAPDTNILFYHPALRPSYYKMIPLTDSDPDGDDNSVFSQDVYLVWRSASRGRTLQVKHLFTVASGWGYNWDVVHFNTNDWIIMFLNTVANWDTDELVFKYYIIERNPPFRIFTKDSTSTYTNAPWITAWRRITPA